MRTIFITIFQGVEAKNILRTGIFTELMRHPDIRLVFFVRTPERAAYYKKEFFDPRIVYEVANFDPAGFLDKVFGLLKFQLLRTETTNLRRRMKLDEDRNHFAFYFGHALNWLLARPAARKLLRWLDLRLVKDRRFRSFFEKYQPDVVFLAHLFDDIEISLLREAKRSGVRTVGFVNSWDKLTARCAVRLLPDTLAVYNDIVKREAIHFADMPQEHIRVVGIPQYDLYQNFPREPRETFLKRLGIDVRKRFFLYAPMGQAFSTSDWDVIDCLHRWLEEGTLPQDLDMLVRFQPNDFLNDDELKKRPWLHYDRPGTRFGQSRGVDWDMNAEEIRHLARTLSEMLLLVCYASSMSIDAAVFGKPVINIDFEIKPRERLAKSPTQFYQMTHYKNAIATGGIRMVRSSEELLHWIRAYSAEPSIDAEARKRLMYEQCGAVDGRSGERIAAIILGRA